MTASASSAWRTTTATEVPGALRITARDGSELVKIHAWGSDQLDQEQVELISLLPDLDSLLSLAGQDQELTRQEHSGTHVTNITTADATLLDLGGDQEPATRQALISAEQFLSYISVTEMMKTAAAIRLIVDDSRFELPGGFESTLEFALDRDAVREFIRQAQEDLPGADPIEQARQEILQDADLVAQFRPDKIPSNPYSLIKSRNGFIGGFNAGRYEFLPAGRGNYQPRLVYILPDMTAFDWSVNDGKLSVVYDQPIKRTIDRLSTEEVADMYPGDPELQGLIRTTLGATGEGLNFNRELLREEYTLLAEGLAVDCVRSTDTWRYLLSVALEPFGIQAPDVEAPRYPDPQAWFRSERFSFQPFDSELIQGGWVMQLILPADKADVFGDFAVGQPVVTHAFVVFQSDGSANASGGVLPDMMYLQWEVLDDGRLQLTYPQGQRQVIGILDVQGAEYGFLFWYHQTSGLMHAGYWRAVKMDPYFSLSENLLTNQPGQYWQSIINLAYAEIDAAGGLDVPSIFGFIFEHGNLLARMWAGWQDPENQTGPYLYLEENWNQRVENGRALIERRYDSNRNPRCTGSDPSCFALNSRSWSPVIQAGDLVYVFEMESWISSYFLWGGEHMSWDPDQQIWVDDDGIPLDMSERLYIFPPRLTAYYLADLPVF